MLPNLLFFLSILFPFCQSSGSIKLTVKSVIDLPNATFTIRRYVTDDEEKKVYDISLVANETRVLTGIPVNYTHPPHMSIDTGPVNNNGFHRKEISGYIRRINMAKVELPFTGLKFERVCDRNWHGFDCKYFCNDDYASIVGRRCTKHGEIGCPFGFHGPNCDQPIDRKSPKCQCQNGGLCTSTFESPLDSKNDYRCECPIGWWGPNCTTEYTGWLLFSTYDKNGGSNVNNKGTQLVNNEFYEG